MKSLWIFAITIISCTGLPACASTALHCTAGEQPYQCVKRYAQARKANGSSPAAVLRYVVDWISDGKSIDEIRRESPKVRTIAPYVRWRSSEAPSNSGLDYIALDEIVSSSLSFLDDVQVAEIMSEVLKLWHGYAPFQAFLETVELNADSCGANKRYRFFIRNFMLNPDLDAGLFRDMQRLDSSLQLRYDSKCEAD